MDLLPHGGDIYTHLIRRGGGVIDFSANINPLGIPAGVRQAAIEALPLCEHYPDPLCRALRRALMEAEQVPADWFFCGNGASDVIYRLARAIGPGRALVTAPTFSEYETALALPGWAVEHHHLRRSEGLHVTKRILGDIRDISLLFLCNPNNPTGLLIEPALLREILARCRQMNAYLVLDECFLEFTDNPAGRTLKGELSAYPKLVLLRAFTKMYAMPGIRLGYCMCSDGALMGRLYRMDQPWSVSVIAQHCGIAALRETRFTEETRRYIKEQREYLRRALGNLGFAVYAGAANYLLFENRTVPNLWEELADRGFLIRACGNYRGLEGRDFRIAVKTAEENRLLVQAITELREA